MAYYQMRQELKDELVALKQQEARIMADDALDRLHFFTKLLNQGWQLFILQTIYKEGSAPHGVAEFSRSGDIDEVDRFYFAPHVKIPEFGKFYRVFCGDDTGEFWNFVYSLNDDEWYRD